MVSRVISSEEPSVKTLPPPPLVTSAVFTKDKVLVGSWDPVGQEFFTSAVAFIYSVALEIS